MTIQKSQKIEWVIAVRRGGFDTSAWKTLQWSAFYRRAKLWWKHFAKEVGVDEFVIREGHFEFSGYLAVGGSGWYFNSGDVRILRNGGLLIRRVTGPKAFTGGFNRWIAYDDEFEVSLRNLLGIFEEV